MLAKGEELKKGKTYGLRWEQLNNWNKVKYNANADANANTNTEKRDLKGKRDKATNKQKTNKQKKECTIQVLTNCCPVPTQSLSSNQPLRANSPHFIHWA